MTISAPTCQGTIEMKIKFNYFIPSIFLLLIIVCNPALAIGQVSRACQYRTIPNALLGISSAFFVAVGAPFDWIYSTILHSNSSTVVSSDIDAKYWILESLTTDYVRARAYLYTVSDQYTVTYYTDQQGFPRTRATWFRRLTSPGWGTQEIPNEMLEDDTFKIWYANRGIWTSSRAGSPLIAEDVTTLDTKGTAQKYFQVIGHHWAYDPAGKSLSHYIDTQASDCNLGDMGLHNHGLFDR